MALKLFKSASRGSLCRYAQHKELGWFYLTSNTSVNNHFEYPCHDSHRFTAKMLKDHDDALLVYSKNTDRPILVGERCILEPTTIDVHQETGDLHTLSPRAHDNFRNAGFWRCVKYGELDLFPRYSWSSDKVCFPATVFPNAVSVDVDRTLVCGHVTNLERSAVPVQNNQGLVVCGNHGLLAVDGTMFRRLNLYEKFIPEVGLWNCTYNVFPPMLDVTMENSVVWREVKTQNAQFLTNAAINSVKKQEKVLSGTAGYTLVMGSNYTGGCVLALRSSDVKPLYTPVAMSVVATESTVGQIMKLDFTLNFIGNGSFALAADSYHEHFRLLLN